MTTRRPAGALLNADGMIGTANEDDAPLHLLEVTLHAKIGITHRQQFRVHRTVRRVAACATLPHGLVLKHVRPALRGMAFQAIVVLGKQRRATTGAGRPFVR